MNLLDPDELGEARVERHLDVLAYDGHTDTILCANCGRRGPLAEMVASSPDPYAAPICRECAEA